MHLRQLVALGLFSFGLGGLTGVGFEWFILRRLRRLEDRLESLETDVSCSNLDIKQLEAQVAAVAGPSQEE